MDELQVTSTEELDLLVKWLGPESSKHALSIRASNVSDPNKRLERIWARLDERYGCPEMVETALKLGNKDSKKLYELSDLVAEIESAKEDHRYKYLLAYFDSSSGVRPIVSKLPYNIQEKWTTAALKYKRRYSVSFPPFSYFVEFLRDIRSDPSFVYDTAITHPVKKERATGASASTRNAISAKKTDIVPPTDKEMEPDKRCPVHKTNYSLNQCKGFKVKPVQERKQLLKDFGVCYRCCASSSHMSRVCKETVKCADCGSEKHPTALHVPVGKTDGRTLATTLPHGGEKASSESTEPSSSPVTSKCTQVCREGFSGKSCAKTMLVRVFPDGRPEEARQMYAILDDQSNMSHAKSKFFELLDIHGEESPYTLSSCAGSFETSGRRASGFVIESLDSSTTLDLPNLIECNQIPDVREEIPTPEVAQNFNHLKDIAQHIPPLAEDAEILLLIGRDLPDAHHVHSQRIGPRRSPFAQKLSLGWVIVGEAGLGKVHKPDFISVNNTNVLRNGRPSTFQPCSNEFNIRINPSGVSSSHEESSIRSISQIGSCDQLGDTVFERHKDDDKTGMSIEDKEFLQIMDNDFQRDLQGNWIAPLPFRSPRPRLPNNKPQALKRAMTLDHSLKKNPEKRKHFTTFMERVLKNGHAELAPPLKQNEECWYLPIFGVYHPKKPNQIRAVFGSSAPYDGISLNDVLLTGPDLTNSLLGILLRFRKQPVAMMADLQQMYYCFSVREDHRNFLRFLWYRNNDPDQQLVEYRMRVHVFGNSPSPAVATYGLRKTAKLGEHEFGTDMRQFVQRNFYVDDGLVSLPTARQAVDLMQRTQLALSSKGNLRLHKIASNNKEVMSAFRVDDHAQNLKEVGLGTDILPLQRSFGLIWDLESDTFMFQKTTEEKPYTKRGVLSIVNSLFDPLGFLPPVVIQGKMFLRDLISNGKNWDEPLPVEHQANWED